ncbi:MAG: aminomethyl-transferring glycine dehydrogenase subunit GcvPB [candidate division WOR-3 bacterium]
MKTIFEHSTPGKRGYYLPPLDLPEKELTDFIPKEYLRENLPLPEVSEVEVVRHFVNLSTLNHHVDKGFYPLGSCTMKYNPKVNETIASFPSFTNTHPWQEEETVQGNLFLMSELGKLLLTIVGMDAITLQPAAGAHGEFTSLLIVRKYFKDRGEKRERILIPDSAHGTNPASVTMSGHRVEVIPSDETGQISLTKLRERIGEDCACLMVTNPNTLGIFEERILEIAEICHSYGTLLYLDGANLNAYLGYHRPGDAGFDLVHLNLHKTFSTPHGGGGPGAGPVCAKKFLEPYLPIPRLIREGEKFRFDWEKGKSIGKIQAFYGNFLVLVKAFTYIRMLGPDGLRDCAESAVLNANYIRKSLEGYYHLPYKTPTMHECVFSAENLKKYGVRALDVAKRLLDFGLHAPTMYFPLIVHEALMIEPTETESKEVLDEFIKRMIQIAEEAKTNPEILQKAPHQTPVKRLDEAKAARDLILRYQK